MRKIVSILLSLLLCVGMLPVGAAAETTTLPDNPKSTTVAEVTADQTMENNYGIIMTNYGTIENNNDSGYILTNRGGGVVKNNSGTIRDNYGIVYNNAGTVTNSKLQYSGSDEVGVSYNIEGGTSTDGGIGGTYDASGISYYHLKLADGTENVTIKENAGTTNTVVSSGLEGDDKQYIKEGATVNVSLQRASGSSDIIQKVTAENAEITTNNVIGTTTYVTFTKITKAPVILTVTAGECTHSGDGVTFTYRAAFNPCPEQNQVIFTKTCSKCWKQIDLGTLTFSPVTYSPIAQGTKPTPVEVPYGDSVELKIDDSGLAEEMKDNEYKWYKVESNNTTTPLNGGASSKTMTINTKEMGLENSTVSGNDSTQYHFRCSVSNSKASLLYNIEFYIRVIPKYLSADMITVQDVEAGSDQSPITVKDGNTTLVEGSILGDSNVGDYAILDYYKGTLDLNWKAGDSGDCAKDLTVLENAPTEPGDYTAMIVGLNHYSYLYYYNYVINGEETKRPCYFYRSFKITDPTAELIDISDAVVELEDSSFELTFANPEYTPMLMTVHLGEKALNYGEDFEFVTPLEKITEPGTYEITVKGIGKYKGIASATLKVTKSTMLPDPTAPNGGKTDMQLEMSGEIQVPPSPPTGLDTVVAIQDALKEKLVKEALKNTLAGIEYYDLMLWIKDPDWRRATEADIANFGSITVTLPYPDEVKSNWSNYEFAVTHMKEDFSMEVIDDCTATVQGLVCKFTSLSPVAIGYAKKSGGSTGGSGGGGGVTYYQVKVETAENGMLRTNRNSMYAGGTVTLTAAPAEGFQLEELTVADSQGNPVEVKELNGKFTFKMPAGNVSAKAEFGPIPVETATPEPTAEPTTEPTTKPTTEPTSSPKPWVNPFADVPDNAPFRAAVEYVCTRGLMGGYQNGLFGPYDNISRAQMAQIFWNREGRPQASGSRFSDVPADAWYAGAVNWAAEAGIVNGTGRGKFDPGKPITREEMAAMLWRYLGRPVAYKKELDFADAGQASGYAREALLWAAENGVLHGRPGGVLDPKGPAKRSEVAQMLMNYFGQAS